MVSINRVLASLEASGDLVARHFYDDCRLECLLRLPRRRVSCLCDIPARPLRSLATGIFVDGQRDWIFCWSSVWGDLVPGHFYFGRDRCDRYTNQALFLSLRPCGLIALDAPPRCHRNDGKNNTGSHRTILVPHPTGHDPISSPRSADGYRLGPRHATTSKALAQGARETN